MYLGQEGQLSICPDRPFLAWRSVLTPLSYTGILWPKVYGSTDIEEVRKWSVPHLIRGRRTFPPCFLIHSRVRLVLHSLSFSTLLTDWFSLRF